MALYRIGTMIRETGQALERLGCRLVGVDAFREDICRHRSVMNLGFDKPDVSRDAWVAPNASVVGNVTLGRNTSVWYSAVIKGDESPVKVGDGTNIQDGATIGVGLTRTSAKVETNIGKNVTVGHKASLSGCTIEDGCLIGIGAIVGQGVVMESGSMVAAGSVVPGDARIMANQLWAGNPAKYIRDLKNEETAFLPISAEKYIELAQQHKSTAESMQKKLDE